MVRRRDRPPIRSSPQSWTRDPRRRGCCAVNAAEYEGGSTGTRRSLAGARRRARPTPGAVESDHPARPIRNAKRNDGYAAGVIEKLVTNGGHRHPAAVAGPGSRVSRAAADALFRRWTDESDADGLLDFYGQQTQAARGWFEGGEEFVRFRFREPSDGLSVPLQLQIIEPELCPTATPPAWRRLALKPHGVQRDRQARRALLPSVPARGGRLDASQLRRIPSENVIHLYDRCARASLRPACT